MHCKRKRSQNNNIRVEGPAQRNSKKQRTDDRDGRETYQDLIPSAAFWDNLSFIPLTRSALRELDRRVTKKDKVQIHSSKLRLTKIPARIARHGGLDLTDLRGYPNPLEMPATRKTRNQASTQKPNLKRKPVKSGNTRVSKRASGKLKSGKTETSKSAKTGPYDRAFEQQLVDNHILPYRYKFLDGTRPPKPSNWELIQEYRVQHRRSLSPSVFTEEAYDKFADAQAHASNEKQVSEIVLPIIEGSIEDGKTRNGGVKFSNLSNIVIEEIVPGNPDVYYGARPEQIKLEVRKVLNNLVVPTTKKDEPAAPNFMLACKGPNGSLAVADRQASYDGSFGARGIHALRTFRGEDTFDGNAYCISSIYHGGTLTMYTVHEVVKGSTPFYVMSQIGSWSLKGDPDTFRAGVRAYRNLRDWAREQRNSAIEIANGKVS